MKREGQNGSSVKGGKLALWHLGETVVGEALGKRSYAEIDSCR